MEIKAADVAKLRKMTGAGMMDCKKALIEADGDYDKAQDIIRERGKLVAAKRADRSATEGVVVSKIVGQKGYMLCLACETDFVAKNSEFSATANEILDIAIAADAADLEALNAVAADGRTVADKVTEKSGQTGEKVELVYYAKIEAPMCVTYIHTNHKLGTLIGFNKEIGMEVAKDVAMQIAALNPRFWDKSQVSQDVLDEEKKIMMVQMENDPKMASKPEQVREKIVMGKMNKFYSENCLLQQEFVRGDVFTGSVEQYIADAAKKLGGKITFVDAIRFEKGEGIEKKQENFAEEIAKMVKG